MANIKGSSKNDVLTGTNSADRLQGLAGNDRLIGLSGNDTLEGGGGDDLLQGGDGSDKLDGGVGTDTADYSDRTTGIYLNLGRYATDTAGNGKVEEYDADGTLVGTDTLTSIENVTGGGGGDRLIGNYAFNILRGGDGRDYISGGGGSDRLYGDGGDDLISAGAGNTYIDGGAGIDTFFWETSSGGDSFVDLEAGTVTYANNSTRETLVSIENVRGNSDDDSILGSSVANIVQGGGGGDVIDGRGGDDVLVGDFGRRTGGTSSTGYDDHISGGDGNDLLSGDLGNNMLTGGSGADRFVFDINGGDNRITDFEDGLDWIELYGGLTILGWELRDSDGDGSADSQAALLSNGTSILLAGHATVPASLQDGSGLVLSTDEFAIPELTQWSSPSLATTTVSTMEVSMARPASGKITIKGTRTADDIAVVAQGVVVNGTLKAFSDSQIDSGFIIKGDAGDDQITGGRGPDEIDGGSGNDLIVGGAGADKLLGGDGNDRLVGTMEDRFDGGRGVDTLDLSGSPNAVGVDLSGLGAFFTDVNIIRDSNGYLAIDLGDSQLSGVAKAIEDIIGSSYNDWLVGNGLENVLRGGAGDDAISAAHDDGRVDRLFGEAGNDELYAGSGNDELTGGAGADIFSFNPAHRDGDWVVHDYSQSDGDRVLLYPYSGSVTWNPVDYLGTPSMQANFADGDSITFVGITDYSQIDLAMTMAWPGP